MILQCKNISKSFIVDDVLKDINFIINEGDKTALVGINGAGKTTLFRLITGELTADRGELLFSSSLSVGYLRQNALANSNRRLFQEVYHANETIVQIQKELTDLEEKIHLLSAEDPRLQKLNGDYHNLRETFEQMDGYQYDSLVRGVVKGLGFSDEDQQKSVATLSGGQKTRVALAMELIRRPALLMLDEPTNHLDIDAIGWLEGYLQSYRGTVLIISHDRYFLDQVTNKTIELEMGYATTYTGSFTDFIKEKEHNQEIRLKHYENQQREIKKQEDVITKLKQFNREKSIKRAESREKQLAKIQRIERPVTLESDMNLHLTPRNESGQDVLSVQEMSKSFGELKLFDDLSLEIKKGEKVALIGDNGTGKSTLFKILNNVIDADSGRYRLGTRVKVGYYDQEHQLLNPANTLMDEISHAYPDMTNTEIRNILASYLFKGDDVFKKVSDLSGGEKGRLTLVKLMLSEANFLILDEPTNHLDIISKNILEEALIGYQGTLFVISHDRYFVNRVAKRILHLNHGKLTSYLGNYDDFSEQRKNRLSATGTWDQQANGPTETKLTWEEEKARKAMRRKLETQFAVIEKQIHDTEASIEACDNQLSNEAIYTDHIKAGEITEQKETHESELEQLYETWEELHEAIEKIIE